MGLVSQQYFGLVFRNKKARLLYMEENIIKNDEKLDSVKDQFTPPSTKEKPDKLDDTARDDGTEKDESVTLSKAELDKRIQSAEDKLRTSYTKKIKALEGKIQELSPVEKSEIELELERRLSELEKTQKEVETQKAFLTLQEALQAKGIDKSITSYLKSDVNVDEFVKVFNEMIKNSDKSNGYVPDGHNAGDKITMEEFKSMKYSEMEKIMKNSPELYKRLMTKLKNK